MKRRAFLKTAAGYGLFLGASGFPLSLLAKAPDENLIRLSILHTNDVHSRIEPFPLDGGKYEGEGGVAKRMALIRQIRSEVEQVLLLDAGDMFQGTPYFNYFKGEIELKMMSKMGYDAGTIGNHDFDAGIEGLHQQLPHANFPLLNCNYDFSDTVMQGKVEPYRLFEKGPLRIGVTGLGIELQGLVPDVLFGNTRYLDPLTQLNKTARHLKRELDCDYVICLSHLGYRYDSDKISDLALAQQSVDVDLIIGGHTHTFLEEPTVVTNSENQEVLVTQAGWAGIVLGRLDVYFERGAGRKCVACKNQRVY